MQPKQSTEQLTPLRAILGYSVYKYMYMLLYFPNSTNGLRHKFIAAMIQKATECVFHLVC